MIHLTILLGLAINQHQPEQKFSSIDDSCSTEFKAELSKCEELKGVKKTSCQAKANTPYVKCINWTGRG